MNQDIHKTNFWNFGKNSNFLLFIDIEWLEMIVSKRKWSLLMILTTKKAAHIAKFAEFVWFVWLCSYVQTVKFRVWNSSPETETGVNYHAICMEKLLKSHHVNSFSGVFLPFGTTVGREINTTPVTREKIEIAPSHHVDNY